MACAIKNLQLPEFSNQRNNPLEGELDFLAGLEAAEGEADRGAGGSAVEAHIEEDAGGLEGAGGAGGAVARGDAREVEVQKEGFPVAAVKGDVDGVGNAGA